MRKRLASDRPDWPQYRVRNINPTLWQRVIDRAKTESFDGSPRLNAVLLHLLEYYAASGLPALPGFPQRGASADPSVSPASANPATVSPTPDPTVNPTSRPTSRPLCLRVPCTCGQCPPLRPTVNPSARPLRRLDVIGTTGGKATTETINPTPRPSADPINLDTSNKR
jgi:hypothetical protein